MISVWEINHCVLIKTNKDLVVYFNDIVSLQDLSADMVRGRGHWQTQHLQPFLISHSLTHPLMAVRC